ncbi:MAG: leucine-rich repeat protein [Candidatus Methanomethylophilaceae archaeon]|nr:leucine-rich repeat protein [Candidatus Methanomethylophilaceae archaeon]
MSFEELVPCVNYYKGDVNQALTCEWVLGNHGDGSLSIGLMFDGYQNYITVTVVHTPLFSDDESEDVKLMNALLSVPVDESSRLAAVTSIHDAVCDMLEYDYGDNSEKSYSLYNAVTGDHIVVCEGYAKTFLALCQLHGIPCVGVTGTATNSQGEVDGHMYNMVQMENGKWYAVDVTWDDQDWIDDTYLLAGSNTVGFHGVPFYQSHHPDGLTPPPLAADAYEPVKFSFEDGALVFYGDGAIDGGTDAPWNQYSDETEMIVIEEGITSVGSKAFYQFGSVWHVIIGSDVESIGSKAFAYCGSLRSLEVPGTVKSIGTYAFYKSGIESLDLGDGVKSVGAKAFQGCPLKNVKIASTVKTIGTDAFGGCSFYDADGKTALSPTPGLISGYTFKGTPSNLVLSTKFVKGFTFTKGSIKYAVTASLAADRQLAVVGYEGDPVDVVIPSKVKTSAGYFQVTSIGAKAFYGCSSLKSLKLENVETIGSKAFAKCSSLSSLEINESVKTVSSYAFYGCKALKTLTVHGNGTSIGTSAFSECKGLETVELTGNGITVGTNSFYNCTGLTSLDLSGVVEIGTKAFPYCNRITDLTIPGTVSTVGAYAFYKCAKLDSVVISNGVKTVGKSAFSGCGKITSLAVGQSVSSIGDNAFYGYKFLDAEGKTLKATAANLRGHAFQGAAKTLSMTGR